MEFCQLSSKTSGRKVKLNGNTEILDSLLGFYFQNIKDPFKLQEADHEVVNSKKCTYQQISQESSFSSLKSPRVGM